MSDKEIIPIGVDFKLDIEELCITITNYKGVNKLEFSLKQRIPYSDGVALLEPDEIENYLNSTNFIGLTVTFENSFFEGPCIVLEGMAKIPPPDCLNISNTITELLSKFIIKENNDSNKTHSSNRNYFTMQP